MGLGPVSSHAAAGRNPGEADCPATGPDANRSAAAVAQRFGHCSCAIAAQQSGVAAPAADACKSPVSATNVVKSAFCLAAFWFVAVQQFRSMMRDPKGDHWMKAQLKVTVFVAVL